MKQSIVVLARACALASCIQTAAAVGSEVVAAGSATDDPLTEIVVTATRSAQPAGQVLEPIVIIDRGALEASLAIDVGDVLRYHAGLDIGRSGGPGQPLSLFIRGANSDQSIIMIDGVRINAGTIGLAPLQNLAPELFERIEVVKGPRSAIYGTDAIGGVVNLITRAGGPSGADAMLGYGRYATGEFSVDGNYTTGDTSLRAALTGQRSDGFAPIAGDTVNAGYKNWSGTVTASTRIGGVEAGAFYWSSTGTTDYANANFNYDMNTGISTIASFTAQSEKFANSALAAHASGDPTDIWHTRVTLSRVVDDLRQQQFDPLSVTPRGDFDYTSRATLDWQNDLRITGNVVSQLVTAGAILTKEHTNSLVFGTEYAITTDAQTYYAQNQLEAGANRLLLAVGLYHHPAFGDHPTWNAEYGLTVTPNTVLIASAGTAFRAPSATDRFGFGGTPDLKPESSRNLELGVKARVGESQRVTFAAFQDTITDLIVFVNDQSNHVFGGENSNVDRARIRGLEASWEWHADAWTAHAEGSVQDPRNLSANAASPLAADTQLLRRTKHSFTVSGSRRLGRGEIGIDILETGARADADFVTFAPVSDGGYVLTAIFGKLELTPNWTVQAHLDNALDRRYQLANGYNSAGRAASVAVRYRFP